MKLVYQELCPGISACKLLVLVSLEKKFIHAQKDIVIRSIERWIDPEKNTRDVGTKSYRLEDNHHSVYCKRFLNPTAHNSLGSPSATEMSH